jgi:hypothetical protein
MSLDGYFPCKFIYTNPDLKLLFGFCPGTFEIATKIIQDSVLSRPFRLINHNLCISLSKLYNWHSIVKLINLWLQTSSMKMTVFSDVAPCSSLVEFYLRFIGACCLKSGSPWWRRLQTPLKRRYTSMGTHGATSRKTVIFILAALRNWNLTSPVKKLQRQHSSWLLNFTSCTFPQSLKLRELFLSAYYFCLVSWNCWLYFRVPPPPPFTSFRISFIVFTSGLSRLTAPVPTQSHDRQASTIPRR